MGDITYMGFKGINSDTTIKGELVVTGSISSTDAIKEDGVALVTLTLVAMQKMVVPEITETTTIMNFDFVSTSDGDVVVYEAL